jgi:CTD small phosphatase-like protein 2
MRKTSRKFSAVPKTLVLDLDETLVHTARFPTPNTDYCIVANERCEIDKVFVSIRPGVKLFLQTMSKHFEEIVIFTAGSKKYAN